MAEPETPAQAPERETALADPCPECGGKVALGPLKTHMACTTPGCPFEMGMCSGRWVDATAYNRQKADTDYLAERRLEAEGEIARLKRERDEARADVLKQRKAKNSYIRTSEKLYGEKLAAEAERDRLAERLARENDDLTPRLLAAETERDRYRALAGRQHAALFIYGQGIDGSGLSYCQCCGACAMRANDIEHREGCILADPDGQRAAAEWAGLVAKVRELEAERDRAWDRVIRERDRRQPAARKPWAERVCACGHVESDHRSGGLCETCIPTGDSTGAWSGCQSFRAISEPEGAQP